MLSGTHTSAGLRGNRRTPITPCKVTAYAAIAGSGMGPALYSPEIRKRFLNPNHFTRYISIVQPSAVRVKENSKMFRWKSSHADRYLTAEYATRKDFQKIFTEDMADLHLLAFLLTADQDKADQCFVSGLEDSINGNPVFREWARSWSKRAIIKNAIKALAPAPGLSAP